MVNEIELEFEQFYAHIISGGGCLRVTIPNNIIEGTGFKKGDKVKVLMKKIE